MPLALPINAQLTLAPYSEFFRASTQEKAHEDEEESSMMLENGIEEGLLGRAEPLEWAEEIFHKIVEMRVVDGALLLDADPAWAGAINTVLVMKGVRVNELRFASRAQQLR